MRHAVIQYQMVELLNAEYGRATSIKNAFNDLKASGIWPPNRIVFQECDFVASAAHQPGNASTDIGGHRNGG